MQTFHITESTVFGSKFLKCRFWWIYPFADTLNPKITFIAVDLSACVCLCVYYKYNWKTNCSWKSSLVFFIPIIHTYYSKLFIKIGQNHCVLGHTENVCITKCIYCLMYYKKNCNTLRLIEGISFYSIFAYLDSTKCNEINVHFWHGQKHVNDRIGYEWHS